MSEAARSAKSKPRQRSRPWDVQSFLDKLETTDHSEDIEPVKRVIEWVQSAGLQIRGGTGPQYGTLYFGQEVNGELFEPFYLYEGYRNASFAVYVSQVRDRLSERLRSEFDAKLSALGFDVSPGCNIPESRSAD